MKVLKSITRSEKETEELGFELGGKLKCGEVVFLFGPLGAGKTTFIRGIARRLGFTDVFSPSFVIVNVYPTEPPFYHIDLFRIKNEAEIYELGLEDIFGVDCIVAVEWAEKLSNLYDGDRVEVYIEPKDEFDREIIIKWVEGSG